MCRNYFLQSPTIERAEFDGPCHILAHMVWFSFVVYAAPYLRYAYIPVLGHYFKYPYIPIPTFIMSIVLLMVGVF